MTTERQKLANAANAAKSTGPRTSEGRAKSAGNARKHGLNAVPPWDEVSSYLILILGSADVDALGLDTRSQAALALAEAEARLAHCLKAERQQLSQMADLIAQKTSAQIVQATVHNQNQKIAKGPLSDLQRAQQTDRSEIQMPIEHQPSASDQLEVLRRSVKIFTRYRREADAQRRKALRRWLEAQPVGGRKDEEELALS